MLLNPLFFLPFLLIQIKDEYDISDSDDDE
jgi:hypothetical protein